MDDVIPAAAADNEASDDALLGVELIKDGVLLLLLFALVCDCEDEFEDDVNDVFRALPIILLLANSDFARTGVGLRGYQM